MTIEQDLKVDLLDLVTDAAQQPTLYHNWAFKYAKAHSNKVKVRERIKVEKIRIKQELDEKKAAIESDIRTNWDSYSSEKKTEGGVMALLVEQEGMKTAQDEYLKALTELNQELVDATHEDLVMEAARDSMQQRQSSIKIAAELYLGGYFSDTPISPRIREEKEVQNKQVQSALKAGLKKRRTE